MRVSKRVKLHIAFFLFCAAMAVAAIIYIQHRYQPSQEVAQIEQSPPIKTATDNATGTPPSALPKTFLLKIPFSPQAPTGNWDTLHNEACEETSAIMAATFFGAIDNGAHQTDVKLPPDFVEAQLSMLTQWEQNHFGYYLDINTKETAQMIEQVYGLKTEILTDYTETDIKNQMLQNHVVLLPANGVKLGNPNFRSPGPPYHMLVLKGYEGSQIITNDPGTRNGLNYPYSFNTLYAANGDYDHATHEVDLSKKMVIVVWK